MDQEKILTISVAAYNLGKMIEDNLEPILKAKNKEAVEVIVTDDGSKDNTAEYIKKYVEKYPDTFKLVSKENQGAGSTVNSGIKHATGKYFKMIDGDDWIKTEDLEKFVDELKKCNSDIVLTNYEIFDETKKSIIKNEKLSLDICREKNFSDICAGLTLNMYNITIKTNILKDNNIVLDNGFYTDVEYLLLPIPFVRTVTVLNLNAYVYRVARVGQSVSLPNMQKHIKDHDLVFKRLIKYYEVNKEAMDENRKKFMRERIASMAEVQLGTLLSMYGKTVGKKEIRAFMKEIQTLSQEIYDCFSNKKKASIILKSKYILTPILSKVYIMKNS